MERSVWIGFDPREVDGYAVTRTSLERNLNSPVPIRGLILSDLMAYGTYTRKTEHRDGRYFDVLSNHAMATEFALSRFLVPYLVRKERGSRKGNAWALFMDSDILVTGDVSDLFEQVDDNYAVMVVKHEHKVERGLKMDGQVQVPYPRKNWSSVIMYNVNHPANDAIADLNVFNNTKGLALHQFCWLMDKHIGELSPKWNYLVGHNKREDLLAFADTEPAIIHFTEGLPSMGKEYAEQEYALSWFEELRAWAR